MEFVDGHSEILSTNIIAENLFYQVDEEGYHQKMLLEISDHRVLKDAISKDKGTFYTDRGLERKVRTTKGWELYVTWKDGPGDWISLKDLKNCYPLEVVDYAMAKEIQDKAAFAWWIPWTLKKRTHIISMVKTKYWDKTHKFGIKVPKSITEAKRIDLDNKNKLWTEAVRQEIINVRVALKKYDGDTENLIGYQEITLHMIFDIKISENFRCKARLAADGHKTHTPLTLTYSSVVSHESVRICLLIAALNDLDVLSADIQNAYLTAPNKEKV